VYISEINSGITFLSHKTKANEYLTVSKLLFTALVALLNLTGLSLSEECDDPLGLTGETIALSRDF